MNFHPMDWLVPIQAIGWTLLHFLWQGGLVGLAYAIMRRLVAADRCDIRYAAGLLALAIIAICPLLTFALVLPAWPAAADIVPGPMMDVAPGGVVAAVSGPGFALDRWLPWLVLAWTLGVVAMACRSWRQWRALARVAQRHAKASPELERSLARLARRFGMLRSIRVLISDHIDTPTLIGWLKPIVLLPTAVALGFPRQQLELILAHELGHLRRYDHLVNLAQAVLETLLFYHPVVHWISTEVRNEREICCDRLVLELTRGEPREYARTLASLEELRMAAPRLALAATGGVLLDRVRRIVGVPMPHLTATRPSVGLSLLAAAAIMLVGVGVLRPSRLDELATGVSAVLDRVPRPSVLALGGFALELAPPPKWTAALAKPRLVLPHASAASAVDPEAKSAGPIVHLAGVPRSSMLLAEASPPSLREPRPALPSVADIPVAAPAAPPARVPAQGAEHHVSPVALHTVVPRYPAGVDSPKPVQVALSFALGADGSVRDVQALGSADAAFYEAARHALSEWRFDPATVPADPAVHFRQTFLFNGSRRHQASDPGDCIARTGSRICRHQGGEEEALPLTIIGSSGQLAARAGGG